MTAKSLSAMIHDEAKAYAKHSAGSCSDHQQADVAFQDGEADVNSFTWDVEEQELSDGISCVVYDEHGVMLADHLTRERANLIAAAPALYNALFEARLRCSMSKSMREEINSALAKARGEM